MSETLAFRSILFHGDTSFRPVDWRIKFTPEGKHQTTYMRRKTAWVNIDVRKGNTRLDAHLGLQEAFVEAKLLDLSHDYDFVSVRARRYTVLQQRFPRIHFSDQEPGLRIFGNLRNNRYQYNLAYFAMLEKDTNSGLNRLDYRHQQVMIANLLDRIFLKPGYTIHVSSTTTKTIRRLSSTTTTSWSGPRPLGFVKPGSVRAFYYGLTATATLARSTSRTPSIRFWDMKRRICLRGSLSTSTRKWAAVELSLDRDWLRYRLSFFYASGDKDPRDGKRSRLRHNLRQSKFRRRVFQFLEPRGNPADRHGRRAGERRQPGPGSSFQQNPRPGNFVNPGLFLYNAGVDIDITPKLRGFLKFEFDSLCPH